ncbi:hypothetical protein [Alteribacillus sp. YIM 98480]|uniref:hypothetical protein n=1 Tax=Alteribacillus sp. YIM 98480 TaxID=2606599 RepID=UPI00131CC3B0|nr:hypothetical protein [Alteribacillus sp. YIM 98480]
MKGKKVQIFGVLNVILLLQRFVALSFFQSGSREIALIDPLKVDATEDDHL